MAFSHDFIILERIEKYTGAVWATQASSLA
jgi:hypothetical protein